MTSNAIAVVIPFFQREAGILSNALKSIWQQTHNGRIDVLIVDDGSPVPAERDLELAGPPPRSNITVRVVKQENAGPAAARNRALDLVTPGVHDHIAFLDSDDVWDSEHLERAVRVLDGRFDFYFSDHLPINRRRTGFLRDDFHPHAWGRLIAEDTFSYEGDFFDQTLRRNVVALPTVVLQVGLLTDLRFNPKFRWTGEDHLFWLEVSRRKARIAISSRCETICGKGVNIYESGRALGCACTFNRIRNELRFRKALPSLFALSPDQTQATAELITALREEYAINLLHATKSRNVASLPASFRVISADPVAAMSVVREAARTVKRKIGSRLR